MNYIKYAWLGIWVATLLFKAYESRALEERDRKERLAGIRSALSSKDQFFIPTENLKPMPPQEAFNKGPWVAKHMLLKFHQNIYEIDFIKQKIYRLSANQKSVHSSTNIWIPWTTQPLKWIQINFELAELTQIWIQSIPSSFRPATTGASLTYYQLNHHNLLLESRDLQKRWQVVYESMNP